MKHRIKWEETKIKTSLYLVQTLYNLINFHFQVWTILDKFRICNLEEIVNSKDLTVRIGVYNVEGHSFYKVNSLLTV